MVGYPAAYLALLYKQTKDPAHLIAAQKYLDIALAYKGNVLESNFSHKIAWAASILLEITGDKKYLQYIHSIADHFLKSQGKNGMWYVIHRYRLFAGIFYQKQSIVQSHTYLNDLEVQQFFH